MSAATDAARAEVYRLARLPEFPTVDVTVKPRNTDPVTYTGYLVGVGEVPWNSNAVGPHVVVFVSGRGLVVFALSLLTDIRHILNP